MTIRPTKSAHPTYKKCPSDLQKMPIRPTKNAHPTYNPRYQKTSLGRHEDVNNYQWDVRRRRILGVEDVLRTFNARILTSSQPDFWSRNDVTFDVQMTKLLTATALLTSKWPKFCCPSVVASATPSPLGTTPATNVVEKNFYLSQNLQFILTLIFPKTSINSIKIKISKNVMFSNIWVLYLTVQFFWKKL